MKSSSKLFLKNHKRSSASTLTNINVLRRKEDLKDKKKTFPLLFKLINGKMHIKDCNELANKQNKETAKSTPQVHFSKMFLISFIF